MVETWREFKSPENWSRLMKCLDSLPGYCHSKHRVLILGSYKDKAGRLLISVREYLNLNKNYDCYAFLMKDVQCEVNLLYLLRFLMIISNSVFHITEELTRHGHIFESGFLSVFQEFIDKTTLFIKRGIELSYMVKEGFLQFFEEGRSLFYYQDENELFGLIDSVISNLGGREN